MNANFGKIMRAAMILTVCGLYTAPNIVGAQQSLNYKYWYGEHSEEFITEEFINHKLFPINCSNDEQDDTNYPVGGPDAYIPVPGDTGGYYHPHEARTLGPVSDSLNQMRCQWYDSTKPKGVSIGYYNGWTNNRKIEISVQAQDYGGSFTKNTTIWAWGGGAWVDEQGNTQEYKNSYENIWHANGGVRFFSETLGEHKKPVLIRRGFSHRRWSHSQYEPLDESHYGGSVIKKRDSGFPYVIIQKRTARWGNKQLSQWSPWEEVKGFDSFTLATDNSGGSLFGTFVYDAPPTPGTGYQFRFLVVDGAGNRASNGWVQGSATYLLDTVPPEIDKTTITTPVGDPKQLNFMAGERDPIRVQYDGTDGSPIQLKYEIEDDTYKDRVNIKNSPGYSYDMHLQDYFKNVDNDRNSDNGRPLDMRILTITDQAGNVATNVNKGYTFYMFANIVHPTQVNSLGCLANPTTCGAIADGAPYTYTQELKDNYNNLILPSTKIGRTLTAQVQTVKNTMYLNQQTRSGGSSVFVDNKNLPLIDNGLIDLGEKQPNSNNGYEYAFKVYTPTANAYDADTHGPVSDPKAQFSAKFWIKVTDDQTKIKSEVNKNLPSTTLNNPTFKPPFITSITGDLRDGGFIEGANQNNTLTVTNISQKSVQNGSVQFLYHGSDADKFTLTELSKNLSLDQGNRKDFVKPFTNSSYPFKTFLKQNAGQVADISKVQLSTHFAYTLDGHDVVYNSDIIGKASYFDNENDESAQVGVKIIGNSNNGKLSLILNNQQLNIGNNLSSTITQDTRNQINQSIALETRNMTLQQAGTSVNNAGTLPRADISGVKAGIINRDNNTSIMLIEANGKDVTLNLQNITGTRTVVVRGGNVIINKNMYYSKNNSQSNVLAVVVYKDSQGRGGNLYVEPDVTNIVGAYVLDGAMMSYKNSQINTADIGLLKNQLYLYGSLVSYNTIGGARSNDKKLVCPVFVTGTCDEETAQKYDLNFLRRYYLNPMVKNVKIPFGGGKVAGDGMVQVNGSVTFAPGNPLKTLFNNTSHDLAKYPFVIQYDQHLFINPPIGLEVYR